MDKSINLTDIKRGFPGISLTACNNYYEACMVCLHRNQHKSKIKFELKGDIDDKITLNWENYFDDQIDRTWQDQIYCTDHGAVCLSVLLVKKYTNYTIIQRARIGTGFDYWLGKENEVLFQSSARLEISGIFKESEQNSVNRRFNIKRRQTDKSDNLRLPVYISIIEFSTPKALFAKK
ncbi:MAG: hypothetical protein LBO74_14135 [Candidatus Symbiothrix sp.]|jgi:hypothetical protein|nr:hypothetical protein [Candidatus Symbiothrix sp.]